MVPIVHQTATSVKYVLDTYTVDKCNNLSHDEITAECGPAPVRKYAGLNFATIFLDS